MSDAVWERWQSETPPWSGEFHQGKLVPGASFLFVQQTSPLPAAAQAGWWQWFQDPVDLVNHLRCAAVPDFVDIWFDRGSYDPEFHETRVDPRRTLRIARDQGFRVEDIPVVEGVLDELDGAADLPPEAAVASAESACDRWTERFGRTPTWDLILRVFPTLGEAAAQLRQDQFEPHLDDDQWAALVTAAARGDETASEELAQEFREAEYF